MQLDVLIPTYARPSSLAVTLTALAGQTLRDFRVVISDQNDPPADAPEARAVARVLHAQRRAVEWRSHLPRRGMAEQRQFLLDQARAPYVLYLDDDVLLEPDMLERMLRAIRDARCAFVGSAVIGLSYADDVRPHQQAIELFDGPVMPETVRPHTPQWERHHLHSAANLWHVQRARNIAPDRQRLYKVAWVGGCVMYDTARLREVGGFGFWTELPHAHCGEEVLVQLRLMARWGGAGLIPSGAFHLELPTTVPVRDVDAPKVLAIEPARDSAGGVDDRALQSATRGASAA